MPSYHPFTSPRSTEPDRPTLVASLRALDPTADLQHQPGTTAYVVKKATAWTGPQITAAQNVLDTVAASSPQLTAQDEIDHWSLSQKAFALALLDAINTLRQNPTAVLPVITPAQVLQAIRTKAGEL